MQIRYQFAKNLRIDMLSLQTFLLIFQLFLLGVLLLADIIYNAWKSRKTSKHLTTLSIQEEENNTNTAPPYSDTPEVVIHKPSSQESEFRERIAISTVFFFLFNYIVVSQLGFNMISCLTIGDKFVFYYDGTTECYQPWQYVFILLLIIHGVPFFLVVMVSRYLLETNQISVTQFFLSYILPLPMLIYWLVLWINHSLKYKQINKQLGHHSNQLDNHLTNHSNEAENDDLLISVNGPGGDAQYNTHSSRDNLIPRVIDRDDVSPQGSIQPHLHSGDVPPEGAGKSQEVNIRATILHVISEPYAKHDNPEASVKYWEGILILRCEIYPF